MTAQVFLIPVLILNAHRPLLRLSIPTQVKYLASLIVRKVGLRLMLVQNQQAVRLGFQITILNVCRTILLAGATSAVLPEDV